MSILMRLIPKRIKAKLRRKFTVHTNVRPYEIRLVSEGRLKGRTAVVTGGSGAIGRAVCFRLAAEGAEVYVSGRSTDKIMKITNEICDAGLKANPFVLDVEDAEAITRIFSETFSQSKPLDILVNCAGGDTTMLNGVSHRPLADQ